MKTRRRATRPTAAFWDSSAIVPLCCHQTKTTSARQAARAFPQQIVWWGSRVEAVSAFSRLVREHALGEEERAQTVRRLRHLCERWSEIQPVDEVRELALRLLPEHPIRSADALQLAAALLWCGGRTRERPFIVGDGALAAAAAAEGFHILRVT